MSSCIIRFISLNQIQIINSRLHMEQFVELVTAFRKKFMQSIVDYTDKGYSILKKKRTSSLSKEESEFVEVYQNTLSLHLLSIVTTIPSTLYYMAYFFAVKQSPPNQKRIASMKKRLLFFFPLSLISVVAAHAFESSYDFQQRLKEIQQYYNQNKDKDINDLRFEYTIVQKVYLCVCSMSFKIVFCLGLINLNLQIIQRMDSLEKSNDQPKIRVLIRKRPLNKKEQARGQQDVVQVHNNAEVVVRQQKLKVDLTKYVEEHQFKFDYALNDNTSNQDMYQQCVKPMVQCAFQGAKVTCFAYGQTGSGKTYTMNGDPENGVLGMYYLGAEDIFNIRDQFYPSLEIYISFYQIYCGKLFDLLNGRQQLQAREDAKQNVNIVGLTIKKVSHTGQFMATVAQGSGVRITSQNSTNADSSRSHAILQIQLRAGKRAHGKLSFIDLAGCQRGADTLDQNKQTKIDGAQINKSLLALKECIRALDQGKNHTPFRGSKLTMVLKDSFTGFCRTLMIGNIAPGSGSCQNTLNTLRYADRVKELKKGGATEAVSKQQKLARELMLPRNGKRQMIPGVDSDDEQEVNPIKDKCVSLPMAQSRGNNNPNNYNNINSINISQVTNKEVVNNLSNAGGYSKKPKYILKDENDRPKNSQTPVQMNRKGMISNHSNVHGQPLKSVNHMAKRDVTINKSVIMKQKMLGWNNNRIQPAIVSERESFNKNNLNLAPKRQISNINVNINPRPHFNLKENQSQWERAVHKFRKWSPSHQNFAQMSQLFEDMVKLIMREEVELNQMHRSLILREEKYQKQIVGLYQQTQTDNKNNSQMLDWASRLSKNLQSRTRYLLQLKVKSDLYQQHLKEHQFCEERLVSAGQALQQGNLDNNFFSNQC